MVGGKGRRGISFAWRQHRFFFDDFLLLALSYEELEETGNEKDWEHGGGVRLTELASPSSIAAVLSSGPLPMERTRNVLLGVLYSHERLTRLVLPIFARGGRSITENALVV